MLSKIRRIIEKNKFINNLINNYNYRTITFSCFSLLFGILYTIFNIIISHLSGTLWYGAIICYYLVLVILRTNLLFNKTKNNSEKKEIVKYRLCGIIFCVLTIILGAMIFLIVREDKKYIHHISVVYIIAGYTIFRICVAIYNIIKVKRNEDYLMKALRSINFVTALISILSFLAIALDTFSKNLNIAVTNAITGLVVAIIVLTLGIYIIVSSNNKIKAFGNKLDYLVLGIYEDKYTLSLQQ